MKNILFISLFSLVFFACKKEATPELNEIKVTSIEGLHLNKDETCPNSLHFGKYYANNVFTITGENLGSVDNVKSTDKDIDVFEFGMKDKNTMLVFTDCDRLDLVTVLSFVLERTEDETQIETPLLKIVGDKLGYAYKSNMASILAFLEDVKDTQGKQRYQFAPDFLNDFEAISGDYEPQQYDIIFADNKYWVIVDKPSIVANAFQRKYQITADTWSCDGNPIEETFEFTTNSDKGIVVNAKNITKTFTP
jgi:hypothetical protein